MNKEETMKHIIDTIKEQLRVNGLGKIEWPSVADALWKANLRFVNKEKSDD